MNWSAIIILLLNVSTEFVFFNPEELMNYYILTYKSFIDLHMVKGEIGVISKTSDYFPNIQKSRLKRHYQDMYPGSDVCIHLYSKKVTEQEYRQKLTDFLVLDIPMAVAE